MTIRRPPWNADATDGAALRAFAFDELIHPLNQHPDRLAPLEGAVAQRGTKSLRPPVGPALHLVIGKPSAEDIDLLAT